MKAKAWLWTLLLAACSSPTDIPDEQPAADGSVITVSGTSVHIRSAAEQCGVVFRVTGDTRILARQTDGSIATSTLANITAGKLARGWADGPIAESCPAQAGAEVILLL
jgi:hypothetical protein